MIEQHNIKELLFSTKTDSWLNDLLQTMTIAQRDKVFTFANWLITDSLWFPFISLNSFNYIRSNRINGEFESKIFGDNKNVNETLDKFLEFCWTFIAHIAVFCEYVKKQRIKEDVLFEILEKTFDVFCETKVKTQLHHEDEFFALTSEFLYLSTIRKQSKVLSMKNSVIQVIDEWMKKKEKE